jgi:hypothetical protein
MARVGKAQKRTKPLYAPTSLIERTEKLWTTIIKILVNNEWPMPN